MAATPYSAVVIVGHRTIILTERSTGEEERYLELQIDGSRVFDLTLLRYYMPGIAVGADHVIVWGGTRLYVACLADGGLRRFDQADEVRAAYPVGARWCLIRETSVSLFDVLSGHDLAEYEHDEVILRNWWEGDRLLIVDYQHRRFVFDALDIATELAPNKGEG